VLDVLASSFQLEEFTKMPNEVQERSALTVNWKTQVDGARCRLATIRDRGSEPPFIPGTANDDWGIKALLSCASYAI